jgi:vacuolar-type H+-ATPase subunit E/Vma4
MEALLERLAREGEAQAAALTDAAEREARARLARAEAERLRRRTEALGRLSEEERHAIERETAAAAHRFREQELRERDAALDRIFAEAERQLSATPSERYRDRLPGLLHATLQYLEGTSALLRCRPEVARILESAGQLPEGIALEPAPDAAPGLRGETLDGRVVVDNTLPALLRRRRADLAVLLTARLDAP